MKLVLNYYDSVHMASKELSSELEECIMSDKMRETIMDLAEEAMEQSVLRGQRGEVSDSYEICAAGYRVEAKEGDSISIKMLQSKGPELIIL